jgi:hypothetical protein
MSDDEKATINRIAGRAAAFLILIPLGVLTLSVAISLLGAIWGLDLCAAARDNPGAIFVARLLATMVVFGIGAGAVWAFIQPPFYDDY